jgi:hypothetical protein
VKGSKAILSSVVAAWLAMPQLWSADGTAGTAALPDWWPDAQSPQVRELGEELSGHGDPAQQALGNLILARHQETLGHLARALNYVDRTLAGKPDQTHRVLATYLRASMLGRMGRFEDQRQAIDDYASAVEAAGTAPMNPARQLARPKRLLVERRDVGRQRSSVQVEQVDAVHGGRDKHRA